MAADRPLPPARIAEAARLGDARAARAAVERLNAEYERTRRSFTITEVAGGFRVMTRPEYGDVIEGLKRSRNQGKLSPAAMETLAIIAYKQPITRAQIETIRGVASGEIVRSLMERRLVKSVGRAEEIGRPMLYGTTRSFLETFGLASLKDLPKVGSLEQPDGKEAS